MKALWIATSLGLVSSVALAQSANRTVVGLDTCFKLVRVAAANCSTPADDAAQRRECLQNARKVQLECLELAGPQASAPVDRPMATAEALSSGKPVEAASSDIPAKVVAPTAVPANPPDPPKKAVEPEKAAEAKPPVMVTGSTSAPPVAQAPAAQISRWTVSETSSPLDYSPLVTATILAGAGTGAAPTELVVRCRGRRSELGLRMEAPPRASRGGEIPVAYQINDQPMVKPRWMASADGKTVNYKGDAAALLQSFSDDARLKFIVSDGSGRDTEATFNLAGWNAIRDKVAAACMWTSTASKSSERR
ncbi:hypothetical protein [Bradyrhizobium roseum]|uniref:hypothetical protein n=1 Tax=Bradyrhizobium roseum TaxID=3056648 RepID=UPI002608EDE3|nr:hypothetical protein [Bradyrhizobium roseus]WKA26025.1 hypothetical protein QUH67_20635 [Bradyrhizobium roseus]